MAEEQVGVEIRSAGPAGAAGAGPDLRPGRAAPTNPLPGGKLTYTLTLTGTGQADYLGAQVNDDLTNVLRGADYNNDATATAGSAPTYTAPRLTWSGTVPAGGSVRITYSVTVKDPVPAGATTLTNAVTTNVPGVCPSGSTDPNCSTSTKLPRLEIAKTATPNPARVGDKVAYTVTVHNTGDADYPNAQVVDDLTEVLTGATYNNDAASTTAPAPTYAAPKLTWTGLVAKGATVTLTYSVTATGASSKLLVNKVSADGSTCKDGCTNEVPLASLTVVKVSSPKEPKPGDKLTYTVTMTNAGQADYTDARIEDDLTNVLTGADYNGDASASTGATPTYAAPKLRWSGTVAKGTGVTVTYSVTVKNPVPSGATTLTNAVTTNIPGQCPPGSTDPNCSTSTKLPRLDIMKTASPNPAKVGDKVVYRVTATNTGDAAYPGASIVDDLTDVLTNATYDNDATATVGSAPTYAEPKLTWTGDLAKGARVVLTYSVTVKTTATGSLVNKVTADGSNCVSGSTDPNCTTTTPVAAVSVTKTAAPTSPLPGGKLTYTITVANTGQADYVGVQVEDDLTNVLRGADYNSDAAASTAPAPTYAAPKLSWAGTVAQGATVTITYSVTVKDPVPAGATTLTNAVTTNVPGVCPPGATDPKCSTSTKVPRLEIAKSATPNPARVGDKVGYTVTVKNTGQADYPNAQITDDLTEVLTGATYNNDAASTTAPTPTYAAPKLTWTGTVAQGATVTITYSVTATGASSSKLVNKVQADGSTCKTACTNEVPLAKVEVRKTASPADPKPGGTVTYTITARNTGEADYPNAQITDDLTNVLKGATYNNDAAAGTAPAPSYTAPLLTWRGAVPKSGAVTITYTVTVKDPVPADGTTLTNAVATNIPGQCPPGSTDPKCSTSTRLPRLEILKTADRTATTPLRAGERITYTVTVKNTGDADDPNVTVTDDLTKVLTGATYNDDAASTTAPNPTYAAPKLTWTGAVPKGGQVVLTYSVSVTNAGTVLVNKVTADHSNCRADSGDPACTTTVPTPSVKVVKKADPVVVRAGGTVTYTVTVTNEGTGDQADFRLTDDLSKVLTGARYNGDATASSGAAPTYTAPRLSWTGTVPAGGQVVIRYTVTTADPTPAGAEELRNSVSTNVPGVCPPGSTDPACSAVVLLRGLEVTKTVDKPVLWAGDTFTYTVTVRNTGGVDYRGATVVDDLSDPLTAARYDNDAKASSGPAPVYAAPKLTWTGDVPKGGSVVLTYSLRATGGNGTPVHNRVTAPDSNCASGSTDPRCTTEVDMIVDRLKFATKIAKTVSPANPAPGDTLTYRITVQNLSGADYPEARLTDDLTEVLKGASYDRNATATSAAGDPVAAPVYTEPTLGWGPAMLRMDDTVTVTYSVTIRKPLPAGVTSLRNSVVGGENSNCRPDRQAPECTTVTTLAKLVLTKTATPGSVKVGEVVGYRITAVNTGTADYTGAVIQDDLTKVLPWARYNGNATSSSGPDPVFTSPLLSWQGTVPAGGSVSITYTVTAQAATPIGQGLVNLAGASGSNCPLPMPARAAARGLRAPGAVDPRCSTLTPVYDRTVVPPQPPIPPKPPVKPVKPLPGTGVEVYRTGLLAGLCTGLALLVLAVAHRRRRG
ncbi:hypothetical protein CFP65_3981 [Kitasatospora sp. MMS16-BH015]|uniref:DUF7927 domain-containing protein n=1 Tax=Kitasatospora sp. MMS16-BH015 TaxID=2018025 RepID=UPI000CA30EED|nr:DUF11 domain-containing protein [Kitasatospora sp. MMS16-BH015]AUG78751.1 hypothetical protein CFP65_3981 [Kitasatospora sp. MMS16-BH015]